MADHRNLCKDALRQALLAYAVMNEDGKAENAPMTQAVHQTLRDFLDSVLAEKFHCQLPDIVDVDGNSRMKDECRHTWDEYAKSAGVV